MPAEAQGFSEAKEVVRGVVHPDERTRDSRNTAVEADRVLAAFLHLQVDINRVCAGVAVQGVGFVLFEGLKVAQLIQPQDTGVPQRGVVNVAFVDQDFAANHFVARRGITGEIDAPNEELLALVHVDSQIDLVAIRHHVDLRLTDIVNVAELAVDLGQVLDTVAELFGRERVVGCHREEARQKLGGAEQLHAFEVQLGKIVLLAFLNGQGNVLYVTRTVFLEERDVETTKRPARLAKL